MIALNGKQRKLQRIRLYSPNEITIQNAAFYNLNNLKVITFYSKIKRIQNEAFAFKEKSSDSFKIIFKRMNLDETVFESGSFDGIQRPTDISFSYTNLTFLPEMAFKSFLDNDNNNVSFTDQGYINCLDCRNEWLFRDAKDKQVLDAKCIQNQYGDYLFSPEIRFIFKSRCKFIYYHLCKYLYNDVSLIYTSLFVFIYLEFLFHLEYIVLSIRHGKYSTSFSINKLTICL